MPSVPQFQKLPPNGKATCLKRGAGLPTAKVDPQDLLEGETLKRPKLDFFAMTGPILTPAPI